jgi:cob(I)alamin adenosyltransferase
MTRIYTRLGDEGETDLRGGARVSKASERVDVYGDIDELNSVVGLAHAHSDDMGCKKMLREIQKQLLEISSELARAPGSGASESSAPVSARQVEWIERRIDLLQKDLPPLNRLVIPGGSVEAAQLQVARAVCRRAERKLVALAAKEPVRPELIRHFNRLSDLLFVMARHANRRSGVDEPRWQGRSDKREPDDA